MNISLEDPQTKELLTNLMIEILKERKELFHKLITEALEEIAMEKAIDEGMETPFVESETIMKLLP